MSLDLSGGGNIGGYSFASLGLQLTKSNIPLLPTTRQVEEEIPYMDGAIDLDTKYGVRQIELTFEFLTSDEITYQLNLSKIAGVFNALKGQQTLVLERMPAKQWLVKFNGTIPIEKIATLGILNIPLKAFNPFSESVNKADEPLDLGDGAVLGMGYELEDETSTTFTATSSPTIFTVDHLGNHVSKPIITITGTGTDISLNNDTTNEGFSWVGTLTSTDTLVIDCSKMTINFNGVNSFANFSGDFVSLIEGENSFTVIATTPDLTINFDYRHVYLY